MKRRRMMKVIDKIIKIRMWSAIILAMVILGLPMATTAPATTIGLDALHGPASSEALGVGSWYGRMREELQANGYALQILYDFTPVTLSTCDAIFISQARSTTEAYMSEEITSIHNYVTGGKGLLAIAEGGYNTDSTVGNFNDLLAPYGVRVNSIATMGNGYVVSGFVLHPVTDGITSVGLDYQRRLISITAPAIDLTLGSGEDNFLAAVIGVGGSGNVVIMSDSNPFIYPGDDTNIYQYDNLKLLMNVSAYTVPEPGTIAILGLGGLALLRKRRA